MLNGTLRIKDEIAARTPPLITPAESVRAPLAQFQVLVTAINATIIQGRTYHHYIVYLRSYATESVNGD